MGEADLLSELFLLMIWLCLPAQLVTLVAGYLFQATQRLISGRSGRRWLD
jgi:hypothetical protein